MEMDPFAEGQDADFVNYEHSLVASEAAQYSLDEFDTSANLVENSSEPFDMPSFGEENAPPMEEEAESRQEEPISAVLSDITPEQEDDLTKFQREWEEKIAAKGKEQERLDREWKEAAKDAYEKFQSDGVARRNARQAANRAHEEAALEKLAADLDSPNPWERVVSLIELDPRNRSETLKEASKPAGSKVKKGSQNSPVKPERKRGKEDQCARMRQLFIQLKSEPLNTTRVIESH
uniref:Clathrin light chain n=1 Tax=Albugo laibachii Nc14 TaxID=890382 RepID=F0W7K0_9STRA|nr:AlNc14C30G2806 [Albugo laibachii Nc14]|eukprot:CCA17101.1 AlNc14C30G2806 [Albugo laibachii Nc14]